MLFDDKEYRYCEYCLYSAALDDESVICMKKGIKHRDSHCRRFSYDPLKRIPSPPALPDDNEFTAKDFTL